MIQPGRKYASSSSKYIYGFNGKENDNEVSKGDGGQQDYGMRIYDTRLGRFLSRDPLSASYPYYSPYQFAGNTPIQAIDLDGEEPVGYSTSARFKHPGKEWIRTADDAKVGSNVHGQWFRMQIKDALGAQWTVFRRETQEIASYGNYHRLETKVDFYYLDNSINAPIQGNNYVTNPDNSFGGNLIAFDARERTDMKQGSEFADGAQKAVFYTAVFLTTGGISSSGMFGASTGGKFLGGLAEDFIAQSLTTGFDYKKMNLTSLSGNAITAKYGGFLGSVSKNLLASFGEYSLKDKFKITSDKFSVTNAFISAGIGTVLDTKLDGMRGAPALNWQQFTRAKNLSYKPGELKKYLSMQNSYSSQIANYNLSNNIGAGVATGAASNIISNQLPEN